MNLSGLPLLLSNEFDPHWMPCLVNFRKWAKVWTFQQLVFDSWPLVILNSKWIQPGKLVMRLITDNVTLLLINVLPLSLLLQYTYSGPSQSMGFDTVPEGNTHTQV